MGTPRPLPKVLHQIWSGDPLPAMCWCSSRSWQRFAITRGWEYKLWRTADLTALVPRMVSPWLWTMQWPKATGMHKQIGIMRSCIARMEILRLYGGLYVDCDILWLGAARPDGSGHTPTDRLLALLLEHSARLTITTNSMRDSLNMTNSPIRVEDIGLSPRGRLPSPLGMWQIYFNNAVLAAGPEDATVTLLLRALPHFVESAASQMKSTQEWRITGPESLNRALTATDEPFQVIPMKWIYPYNHAIYPPPSMPDVASRAFTWGELKPWHATKLWHRLEYILSKTWHASRDQLAPHFRASEAAGLQCFWDGLDWSLVSCNETSSAGQCRQVLGPKRARLVG
jgi:hypothetical protein